jgi:subtilisin family serine protease
MQAFRALAESLGVEVLDAIDSTHMVRVRVRNAELLRRLLREGPAALGHAPNYRAHVPPSEPPDAEKRRPQGEYEPFGDEALRWLGLTADNSSWGSGMTIAVLDTGVQDHRALSGATVRSVDLLEEDPGEGGDGAGHGVAVASLLHEVAPAAGILGVRVMSDDGSGSTFTVAKGIVEAVDRGADVINLCIASRGDCVALREAVAYALARDVAIVASAGNDGVQGVSYPARYDGVVAVGAVDASGRHLYFSNRGAEVDLTAPGYEVASAWSDGSRALFSGTSAAAPLVSGALAAVLAQQRAGGVEEAVATLLRHTDDSGAPGTDQEYGEGILSLGRLQDRGVRGVHDIAAAGPYVESAEDGEIVAAVYAENRGTEVLRQVNLILEEGGNRRVLSFYNVAVGETVSHEFPLTDPRVETPDGVTIRYSAEILGVADDNPMNNGRRSVVRVKSRAASREAEPQTP